MSDKRDFEIDAFLAAVTQPALPRVLMVSMWRNDAGRGIEQRAHHLLAKAVHYPNLAWRWIVGDSVDGTAETLRQLSAGYPVQIVDIGDTGVEGDDHAANLRRLSLTGNHYFSGAAAFDYLLIHESDIVSPPNLVNLLVAHAEQGRCPIAAWPTLEIKPGVKVFYDIFCYRKDGQMFSNHPPYHPAYRSDRPFVVDSAGTVLMFHAEDAGEVIMAKQALLDLCWHLRELGRDIWVDPTLEVVQPRSLWTPARIAREYA
jgi:hypothetical protein